MSEFDNELLTSQEQYQILIDSVADAMQISAEEEKVRKLLRMRAVNKKIKLHNTFLKKGKLKFGCFPYPWFSRTMPAGKSD